ncbi:hypothetical protein ON010_g16383 [Phytophthora cinnamomi]|nr:hypothetical protein ON010_g16383 [Phytophthora cinnamomi]
MKTGFRDTQRVAWLSKGRVQLLLLKSRGRYRLVTTASTVYRVPSLHQRTGHAETTAARDAGSVAARDTESAVARGAERAVAGGAEREAARGRKRGGASDARCCDGDSLVRWHLRFAHLNLPMLKQMAHQEVTTGTSDDLSGDLDTPCWSCEEVKMTRMSYKKTRAPCAKRPFQKIMSDMCHMGIYASDFVLTHVKWLVGQGHKIEVFNSDQGRELINNKMTTYLTTQGIEYTWANGYSPEENRLVERMNGIVAAQQQKLLAGRRRATGASVSALTCPSCGLGAV